MSDLISVIVPVYNVDKYLDRCINSILKQTYSNLEILLIDDGSTDSSGLICDEYASKYENIIVYHKKNGGISSARNYGLDKINDNTKYIAFVDSDDFLHPQMYEILYDNLIENECDIAVCNLEKTNSEKIIEYISNDIKILKKEEYMNQYFDDSYRSNVVWNKLYKKECLYRVRFKEGKIYEDIIYSSEIICNAKKIVINESKLYYYYQRKGSILNGALNPNGWRDFFEAYEFLVKLGIKIKNKIFTATAVENYLGALINRSRDLYYKDKNEYRKYKRKYNKVISMYIFKLDSWKKMLIYILFYININLYLLFKTKKTLEI